MPEEGADLKAIEEAIKTMPNYFDEYDTTVTFITEEELKENHSQMPHGGDPYRRDGNRGQQTCDRIFSEAGFESGVYGKRAGGLCKSGVPSVEKRRERSPHSI